MNTSSSYTKIITDENLMETIQHGEISYPFHYYDENISQFDFHCIDWHWHAELEFVYIKSGTVTVWVGDQKIELSQGSGIFINSRVLHRFSSPSDASIPNFLFLPAFIAASDSLIYQKYVLPVISSALSFQVFLKEVPWQSEILSLMWQVITVQTSDSLKELHTYSLLQFLWLKLYAHLDILPFEGYHNRSFTSEVRLQLMMQFIHQNYSHAITLDDIAGHATISKSTTLNLFHRYLHTTPVNYLISYRLKQAAQLLAKTEKKIHTISCETGFHNVDYFCRLFKKQYHLTPTQYRRQRNMTPYLSD